MSRSNRRQFIGQLGLTAVLPQFSLATFGGGLGVAGAEFGAQTASAASYDLLIAGGRVFDPSQKLAAERDVAVANGKIARIAPNVPHTQARQVFDARGKIVTPGLIDEHVHVFDGVAIAGIDPDKLGTPMGVTTMVDAGSAGATTFPGFRKYVLAHATTRVYALLNISTIGLVVANELYLDPKMVDPQAAIRVIEQNRDLILGIKVRINGVHNEVSHDLDVLRKARQAADATGVPLMVHWTHEPELLAVMKRGDILTHPFQPIPGPGGLLDENGKVFPQILELPKRGIFTELGHGGHFDWTVAQKAFQLGWLPDAISTDNHTGHMGDVPLPNGQRGGTVVDFLTTMSKCLHLGCSLEQVIERSTTNPGKMLKYPERVGTLQLGSVADVTIMDLGKGDFDFFDSRHTKQVGHQKLAVVATVQSGKLVTRNT